MGSTEPRAFSARARWAGGNGAENYRAVWSPGSEGNWRLRVFRELALRSGQERRRCDHGLRMLWSRNGAGVERPAKEGANNHAEVQGFTDQQGGPRRDASP